MNERNLPFQRIRDYRRPPRSGRQRRNWIIGFGLVFGLGVAALVLWPYLSGKAVGLSNWASPPSYADYLKAWEKHMGTIVELGNRLDKIKNAGLTKDEQRRLDRACQRRYLYDGAHDDYVLALNDRMQTAPGRLSGAVADGDYALADRILVAVEVDVGLAVKLIQSEHDLDMKMKHGGTWR